MVLWISSHGYYVHFVVIRYGQEYEKIGTGKFPLVLSEVKKGNFNQYKAGKSNYYQSAKC